MSFYLLKSTFKREYVGDVLLETDQIESIGITRKEYKDLGNSTKYGIKIWMKSNDHNIALFHTIEEAKNVIKEMLGDKVSDQLLSEWISQEP